jgi:hypothetical protein
VVRNRLALPKRALTIADLKAAPVLALQEGAAAE